MLAKAPRYIRKIVNGNLVYAGCEAQHSGYYGYTFRLYERQKSGTRNQLLKDAARLIEWTNRKHATSFPVRIRTCYGPEMQHKRNYVDLVITDPVAQVIGF